jgi:formylglycine-generating enzyme required for sulfatase activity
MSRFWIDRNEVTVARFRAALAEGFVPPDYPVPNSLEDPDCVWTPAPADKEGYALSCVSWYDAHAFCQWVGGDLPTEAQWEYTASAAARETETKYPHGDELPGCGIAAIALDPFDAGSQCFFEGFGAGPQPVDARADTDVTPVIGVIGMIGGLMEHTLDSALPYDHPCWDANGVQDPACLEVSAPRHVARGGAWYFTPQHTLATQRLPLVGNKEYRYLGFRCAYATPAP